MRLVIFGIGQFWQVRKDCFCDDRIVAYIDNNENTYGTKISGVPVLKPDKILEIEYDAICLMAGYKFSLQMKQQLIELGVSNSCIYTFREYFSNAKRKNILLLGKNKTFENEVAIFLPSLENSGGFRAALYALKILLKNYKAVTVVSPCGGNGKVEVEQLGADIIVTADISKNNRLLWNMLRDIKIIFLNGLYYSYLIPFVKKVNKNIIWWIHSGLSFYDVYSLPDKHFKTMPVKVLGVSEIVRQVYLSQNQEGYMKILPFGIPDQKRPNLVRDRKDKIIFAVIGNILKIKGIDLVIEAVKRLDKEERALLEIWLIGAEVNEEYSSGLHKLALNMEEIKWIGKERHDKVMDMLCQIDVVVSASREDMLPMVTIEAMMNGKTCIVSDAVGTASFITNNKNGLIFKSEDIDDLSNKIRWCMKNKKDLEYIGEEARKLYETEFSINVFERRLLEIIKEKS